MSMLTRYWCARHRRWIEAGGKSPGIYQSVVSTVIAALWLGRWLGIQGIHHIIDVNVEAFLPWRIGLQRLYQHEQLLARRRQQPGAIFLPLIKAPGFLETLEGIEFEVGNDRRNQAFLHAVKPAVLMGKQKLVITQPQAVQFGFGKVKELGAIGGPRACQDRGLVNTVEVNLVHRVAHLVTLE